MKFFRLMASVILALGAAVGRAQTQVTINNQSGALMGTVKWIGFPQNKLRLLDTDGTNALWFNNGSNLTADRTLTLLPGDANLILDFSGATAGQSLLFDGTSWKPGTGSGSGNVVGPAESTNLAIARFNSTTGTVLLNSPVTMADTTGAMVWAAGQNASLTAGSSGASLLLGQGTNGNVTISPTGTGLVFLQGLTIGKGPTAGSTNTVFGANALNANTSGASIVAVGYLAGENNTSGANLAALGSQALHANTTGVYNTAIGDGAIKGDGIHATTGSHNTALGGDALHDLNSGDYNNAVGVDAMQRTTIGGFNVAMGGNAMVQNTSGSNNVSIGHSSLFVAVTANQNTAVGTGTLLAATGGNNTALGANAGAGLTTGTGNTFLGYNAGNGGPQKVDAVNSIGIGDDTTASNQVVIGNSSVTATVLRGNVATDGAMTAGGNMTATGGALTLNTDLTLSRYQTRGLKILGAVADTVLLVGADTAQTTNAQNGWRVNTFSDGNVYIDTKTFSGGSVIYRVGQGTESGANLTWLTVAPASGNIAFSPTGTGLVFVQGLTIGKGPTGGATNTVLGTDVINANTTGTSITAMGYLALSDNTSGSNLAAFGAQALNANTTGVYNTALGDGAMKGTDGQATTGSHNVAVGGDALTKIISGDYNNAIGVDSLQRNTTGSYNVAAGGNTLVQNTTGSNNIAIGHSSLFFAVTANQNTSIGNGSLLAALGGNNTAVGADAGAALTTGTDNTFIGYNAGDDGAQKVDAVGSTAIGVGAYTTADNTVAIGGPNVTATAIAGNTTVSGNMTATGNLTGTGGTLTLNTDLTLTRYQTRGLQVFGAVGDSAFLVGSDTSLTTNARNGYRVNTFSDGNLYIDAKTYSGGSVIFRAGQGAESGANITWLTLLPASGNVSYGATTEATTAAGGAITSAGGIYATKKIISGSTFTPQAATSVTTAAAGEHAFDTNAWASGHGAMQVYDGTANTFVVAVLASDTPSDGQFVRWNSDGTFTLETIAGGGNVSNTGTPTTGQIGVWTNATTLSGVDDLVVPGTLTVTTKISPVSNDGAPLGDTTHNFSDLFLASGALINIANGNWVFTHSSGIGTVSTGDLRVTTAGTNAASVVTVDGTQTLANKTLTTAALGSSTATTQSANDNSTKVATTAYADNAAKSAVEKLAVFSVDGGGSPITTGTVAGTSRLPFACTLTGWSISATAATGTNTVKIWNKATGTAIPTISDVINTSGISLTTGTSVASSTLSDFTDTSYAAGDMMRCAITAVDGAATDLTVTLYGTRQ